MASKTTLVCLSFFAVLALGSTFCGSKSSGPTDVPTISLYGVGKFPWADLMVNFSCVYNIKDYAGSPDDAFVAAQNDALRNGGGVVYFPKGTYKFTRNLTQLSNIVIRGAPTTASAKSGKSPGPLAPTTVFQCPNRAHQGIWNFDPQATNIGVVNIFLDQCAVMYWPGLKTSSYSPMMSSWWFGASDVLGMGSNKLVLGNVVRDVSLGHSLLSKVDNPYPYVFSIAIGVYSDSNALVANNLLPASTRSETTTITLDGKGPISVPYMYDNRYGIDVNTILLGAVASNYCKGPGSKCGTPSAFGGLSPHCAPWNFRAGLVIRDNWVAQNGRVGVSWTGGEDGKDVCTQGNGTKVYNNHVEVKAGTTCYTVDGSRGVGGSDTNENRGFMLSGYCTNATGNTAHVNRQKAGFTPYETVDGEGLLHQAENGNVGFGDWIYSNDFSGGGSGYIANYDLDTTKNTFWGSNVVNPDQFIGAVCLNNDVANDPSNKCSNNKPTAELCSCSGGKCSKSPCS